MRLILLLLFPTTFFAQQNCDCNNDLNFVIQYYERNLPGFGDNVTVANRADYDILKTKLQQEATNVQNKSNCFKIISYYVEFFKDNHSRITMEFPRVDESDEAALATFLQSEIYQSRETHDLIESDLKQYEQDDIRGLYQTADTSYTIAVIPDKGALRDYIGVIVDSKTKLWTKGQVKLEIKAQPKGGFAAFIYMKNHSIIYDVNFVLKDGILGDSWFKLAKKDNKNHALNYDYSFFYQAIGDSTTYLRIPTFAGEYSAIIDSLYATAQATITKKPYLIIDVRNNGGGSDDNVNPLLKYIYTKPFKTDVVAFYATPDNVAMWEEWTDDVRADSKNYGKESVKWFEKELKRIKRGKNKEFVTRSKGKTLKRKITALQPKRVVILSNKKCASSCETLLFWAKESDHTIIAGENSGGYVGYGEVGSVQTPCFDYTLYCTMSRYENQRHYEVDGIAPDYYLNNEKNWIEQVMDLMTKD